MTKNHFSMKKVTLKRKSFIDWYFSDNEDIYIIGNKVANTLQKEGRITITAEELLDGCGELPSYIMEEYRDDDDHHAEAKYFVPTEIELID